MSTGFCRWFIPSVIIGATSIPQLAENLGVAAINLDEDTLKAIEDVYLRHREPTSVD